MEFATLPRLAREAPDGSVRLIRLSQQRRPVAQARVTAAISPKPAPVRVPHVLPTSYRARALRVVLRMEFATLPRPARAAPDSSVRPTLSSQRRQPAAQARATAATSPKPAPAPVPHARSIS